ncbi:MAG: hypothetical protein ASARMPREDX12_001783 [Alectoria sarmentosa]|nr:MAG: hypothetical protein ASARMPREDX12_001783 [Alectoria sarmentosa]
MPIADCVQEFKVARNMLLAHLFVYSLGIVIMTNAQTCYYPDGSVVARDTPCHSPSIGDGASACCDSGDICLDNNLCLSQGGAELISRVNPSGGAIIYNVGFKNQWLFCCSPGNPYNYTCLNATKGSYAAFPVEAGLVIFNRTSGSTDPNNNKIALVTVTSTAVFNTVTATDKALVSSTNSPSINDTLSSPSISRRDAAIGAGMGVPLGLALIVTLGLLWRQRGHQQSLKKDVQTWEGRYRELEKTKPAVTKPAELGGAGFEALYQLPGWHPTELDGQPHQPSHQSKR